MSSLPSFPPPSLSPPHSPTHTQPLRLFLLHHPYQLSPPTHTPTSPPSPSLNWESGRAVEIALTRGPCLRAPSIFFFITPRRGCLGAAVRFVTGLVR